MKARLLLLIFATLIFTRGAEALETNVASAHTTLNNARHSGQTVADAKANANQRVKILSDQQRGEVSFVIDGQPVMRVTSQSIVVSGSVIYSGVLQDIGNSR